MDTLNDPNEILNDVKKFDVGKSYFGSGGFMFMRGISLGDAL